MQAVVYNAVKMRPNQAAYEGLERDVHSFGDGLCDAGGCC